MQNLQYHVFKKPKKLKNGKVVRRWYYYWLDETGKQYQKSCGTEVKSRQAAEDFIRTLPPPRAAPVVVVIKNTETKNLLITTPPARIAANPDILVEEIARYMFIPGSPHLQRRQQLKKSIDDQTIKCNRVFMKHIMTTWGSRSLRSLELNEVMNYLFAAPRSSSWKNQYIYALNEIYLEAQFLGCKIFKPDFPTVGSTKIKADAFTEAELEQFFKRENFTHDFFLFFLCSLSGGLRVGETRGMLGKQIIFDRKAVIVDVFLKSNGTRTNYNKKGSPEHPKLRAVPYPDLTLKLLQEHITTNNIGPYDYVFTYDGKPIKKTMIKGAFNVALIKAGIAYDKDTLIKKGNWKGGKLVVTKGFIPGDRKFIHHSLRYTYVTRMSLDTDAHTLTKLTGHDSTAMIDYYNRKNLDLILASIPAARTSIAALLPPPLIQAN